MMNWLKSKLLGGLRSALVHEINKMDKYEDELAELIRKHTNPEKCAKMVIDWVQKKALELLDKVWKV